MHQEVEQAVETMYSCRARILRSVAVREKFRGRPGWEGAVYILALQGHPTAARAYA